MPYQDLREFITQIDALKALRRIDGADPHHEIGAITEVAAGMAEFASAPLREPALAQV